ncbi:MAG TPA: cytochrome c oxidase subunit 4 [Anaerolineales bacterium]|jgi:cytochrome c oxidase subunit 1
MEEKHGIHLPAPSFWPIVLAGGLVLMAVGVVSTVFISIAGVVVLIVAIAGWALENRAAEGAHHE